MNTYEQLLNFAKKLQICGDSGHSYLLREFANKYKKQADRIAELEKENNRLQDHMTELRKIHTERIEAMEKQLSIMEGEYPEPTVFAKITEFNSLEDAYKRIVELEKKQQEILMEVKTSWTAISPIKGMPKESAQQLYEIIKEITDGNN